MSPRSKSARSYKQDLTAALTEAAAQYPAGDAQQQFWLAALEAAAKSDDVEKAIAAGHAAAKKLRNDEVTAAFELRRNCGMQLFERLVDPRTEHLDGEPEQPELDPRLDELQGYLPLLPKTEQEMLRRHLALLLPTWSLRPRAES